MATEQRLIDANALSEKIGNMKFEITNNRGGYKYCNEDEKNEWDKLDSFDSLVCDAPTVDAVEVVRCKDCKSWEQYNACDGSKPHRCMNLNAIFHMRTAPDDFCSYGERRTDHV